VPRVRDALSCIVDSSEGGTKQNFPAGSSGSAVSKSRTRVLQWKGSIDEHARSPLMAPVLPAFSTLFRPSRRRDWSPASSSRDCRQRSAPRGADTSPYRSYGGLIHLAGSKIWVSREEWKGGKRTWRKSAGLLASSMAALFAPVHARANFTSRTWKAVNLQSRRGERRENKHINIELP